MRRRRRSRRRFAAGGQAMMNNPPGVGPAYQAPMQSMYTGPTTGAMTAAGTDGNWVGYSGYQNYGGNPNVSGLAAPNYAQYGDYGGFNTYGHKHYTPYRLNHNQHHASGLNPYRRGGRIRNRRRYGHGGGVYAGTPCSGLNGYGNNC